MALALLENLRVQCADIERRRLAVANLATAAEAATAAPEVGAGAGAGERGRAPALDAMHDNVAHVRDHFVLRQADAAREAAVKVLDELDGPMIETLARTYAAHARSTAASGATASANVTGTGAPVSAAMVRILNEFDTHTSKMREYHRMYPQKAVELPPVERPGEVDVRRVRTSLFTGPERRGRAPDLTAAFKLFREFQAASANGGGAESARAAGGGGSGLTLTTLDRDVSYDEFLMDPVRACAVAAGRRKLSSADAYCRALAAAIDGLGAYVRKSRPLTAEAELADVAQRAAASAAAFKKRRAAAVGSAAVAAAFEALSPNVRDAWRAPAASDAAAVLSADNAATLLRVLELEEHVALLAAGAVGGAVLAAAAEHIKRAALRSAAEEERDDEDDETRFQEDFFAAFYSAPPLSDAIGMTVSASPDAVAAFAPAGAHAAAVGVDGAGTVSGATADGGAGNKPGDAAALNLKNFPVDALGNPIPVWLWKLHQLGKKFFCEICGFAYSGERAFTQHFAEPRHERGLARLGVTLSPHNAAALRLVSTRSGALEALKRQMEGEDAARRRARGEDVEIEDATGNVATVGQLRSL
jgi:hypothetical protein